VVAVAVANTKDGAFVLPHLPVPCPPPSSQAEAGAAAAASRRRGSGVSFSCALPVPEARVSPLHLTCGKRRRRSRRHSTSLRCHHCLKKMVAAAFTVDLDKPLVFQVGHLEEQYQEWVHQPVVSKEGPRFFENGVLEFLTRTKWWAVPLIWLPVVCWCLSTSIQMGRTITEVAMMVVFGIFLWTLIEYVLHRFLFHINTKSYWANTAHYLLQGCHHKHPMDGLRLVFPPAAAAILCFPFWNLIKLFSTPSTTPGLFGGGLLGYVIYDCAHYYLHHGQPSSDPAKYLKKYHLNHHFRIQTKGFGITSTLWDHVFGTLPSTKAADKSI